MSAKSKKLYAPESRENQVLDFNSDALRSLTEKIESNFKNQGKRAIAKDAPARPKTKNLNSEKKAGEHTAKTPVSSSIVKAASNGSTAIGKQKPTVPLKTRQGKKRLRDGRLKEESYGRQGVNVNTTKLGAWNRKIGSDNDTNIDEEIRALGGTQEDVDLIADVLSESELEGGESGTTQNLRSGFEKEILQLVRQLGVDRVAKKELMAGLESKEADDLEEPEETRNLEMVSPNKVMIGVNRALQNAKSIVRGQRSLVSKQQCPFYSPFDIHTDFDLV